MTTRVKGTGPHEVFEGLATPHFDPADLKIRRAQDLRESYCNAVNISANCRGIRCVYCLFNPCATDPEIYTSFKRWEIYRKVEIKQRADYVRDTLLG